MKQVDKKAFVGLLQLVVTLAVALFLPSMTVDYWQAWVFLGVFFSPVLAITLYLMKNDPKLLERRVRAGPAAETAMLQKIIQAVAGLAFLAMFVVSSLDHRFVWSHVPWVVVLLGDVAVALGLLIVFFVFKANTFTSAIIEVGAEQKVVSTGPYAIVRHPMYVGGLILIYGVPLALGSCWALLATLPLMFAIVVRLVDEEKFLGKSLAGYVEYRHRVKYRLIPFIW